MILALIVLLHGGNLQVVENTVIEIVQGTCAPGNVCGLTPISVPKFRTADFNCSASAILPPNSDLDLLSVRFYPSDNADANVYADNDGDDDIPSGTKVRVSFTCEGLK
jgi:hypothetical protein